MAELVILQQTRNGPSYPGHEHHYLYATRKNIISRCYNPNHKHYHRYGGRGILLYPEWRRSHKPFIEWILANLGERPDGYTLERMDNDKGYEPGNLKWATMKEQGNNRLDTPHENRRR